jgi:hypothetical protein
MTRHSITPLLCLGALLACAPDARAQACNDSALDTFQSARRARRILQDHALIAEAASWEARRAKETRLALGLEWPSWTLQGYAVGDGSLWSAPTPLCTRAGSTPADLTSGRVGISMSALHERRGMGAQLFMTQGFDELTLGADGSAQQSADSTQTMFGARLRPWRWTELTLARIQDEPLALDPAAPATFPIDPATLGQTSRAPRYYVAIGVPALDVSLDLILSPQDEGLQTLLLDLRDRPIAGLPWFKPRASLLRLADEARWVGMVGGRFIWSELVKAPGAQRQLDASAVVEASAEWPSTRWRHGRLRLEIERRVSEANDDGLPAMLDLGAYLEGTVYSSAWLARRSDAGAALGSSLYSWVRWSDRPWTLTLEMGWGINRPEALSQLSELRGAPEVRALFVVQYTR